MAMVVALARITKSLAEKYQDRSRSEANLDCGWASSSCCRKAWWTRAASSLPQRL